MSLCNIKSNVLGDPSENKTLSGFFLDYPCHLWSRGIFLLCTSLLVEYFSM